MFISHTSELNEHPSKNAGERTYIERVKEAVATAKHVPQQMNQFTAVAEPPSSYDVLRVNECNVYVGIHGVRWGSPVRDQPELSYTEQEYEAATAAGIPRLLFLLDPSSSELNLPEEALQDPQYGDRQEAFRRRLLQESGCIVKFFRSPDDLAGLVFRSLKELERLSGYREGGRSDWIWPRAWDFRAYRLQKRQGFVGRQWLFEEVRRWAEDEVSTPGRGQALLITADYGVGKSAFLAELIDTNSAGAKIAAHHFCSTEEDATLSPSVFVRSVAAQLAEALPDYRQLLEADDAKSLRDWLDKADQQQDPQKAFTAFDQSVLAPLLSIEAPPQPMLLVVDALDEAQDPRSAVGLAAQATIVQLLARYANRLPPWLKLLATSRRRSDVLKCLQQAFVVKELDAEAGQNLDDLRNYSEERCNSLPLERLIVSAGMTTTEVAGFLSSQEQSRGKFLYLVLVLKDLQSGMLRLASREDLNDLPSGLEEFYRYAFERRFPPEESYALARDILGVLCEAREPIGRRELAAILHCSEHEIGASIWPVHDLLRLQVKATERNGVRTKEVVHSFDHASLAQWLSEEDEWLMQRAGRFAVDREEALQKIRAWGIAEFEAKRAHSWDYLARHLIEHLPVEQRQGILDTLLHQFHWLQVRLRVSGIIELLEDFAKATFDNSLADVSTALRQGTHVLIEDRHWTGHQQLGSQLLARSNKRIHNTPSSRLHADAEQSAINECILVPLTSSLSQGRVFTGRRVLGFTARTSLALPDGRVAIGDDVGCIRILNLMNGKCDAVLKGHSNAVMALILLPDSRLASASRDKTIRIWDLSSANGGLSIVLDGHRDSVMALALLHDGLIASGSGDWTIRLWDTSRNSKVPPIILSGHRDWVTSLAVLPDGQLVSGSMDKTIRLWKISRSSVEAVSCIYGHDMGVISLAVLHNGTLASGGRDSTIKIWDSSNIVDQRPIAISELRGEVTTLAVLPDNRLVAGLYNRKIHVFKENIRETQESTVLEGHQRGISTLATLPNGQLASISDDGILQLWDTNQVDSECSGPKKRHLARVNSLLVLNSGHIVSGSGDAAICVWKYHGRGGDVPIMLKEHRGEVNGLLQLPDGRLASCSDDGSVILWQAERSDYISPFVLRCHDAWIWSLALLQDGRVASASEDTSIRIWDFMKSDPVPLILYGHTGGVRCLVVLADGRIASGSHDKTIRLWNRYSNDFIQSLVLQGHTAEVTTLAVLTDGRLASGSRDSTIRLWSTFGDCSEPSAILFCDCGCIHALVSCKDNRFFSGSDDGAIRIWDTKRLNDAPRVVFVADAPVTALVLHPTLPLLIAGDASGRLHWLQLPESLRS